MSTDVNSSLNLVNSNLNLIDIGANLCDSSFNIDLELVLERAIEHGVNQIIVTGTSESNSEEALDLCLRHPQLLYSTAGIHPHDASSFSKSSYDNLLSILDHSQVKAVGETGLDFNRDLSPRDKQIEVLGKHIELANAINKPLFLHERDAHKKMAEILSHHRDEFGDAVIHCFTGDKDALFKYLDLDLHIGITGWICDERRGLDLANIVHNIPLNRLMIETDSPYLIPRDLKQNPELPKPRKGRRNEPCYLAHIAASIALNYGKDVQEIANATTETSRLFFRL
ncbi:MAG: TatD family hydrolase [Pseudomonadales bacterium]|nr:TatD family hydrolase [Pseudomonadales bacterium]